MRQVVQSGFDAQVLSFQKSATLSRFSSVQYWLMQSKHLDLLLLAGCSCLLTLLYHPVAEALPQAQVATSSSGGLERCITILKANA